MAVTTTQTPTIEEICKMAEFLADYVARNVVAISRRQDIGSAEKAIKTDRAFDAFDYFGNLFRKEVGDETFRKYNELLRTKLIYYIQR